MAGFAGNDTLRGGEDSDLLIGGTGKDQYLLAENVPSSDMIWIWQGESLISHFDTVKNFSLGGTNAVDTLLLSSTRIALDGMGNGMDAAAIRSHNITNGLISVDDGDNYHAALTLSPAQLKSVFLYLQSNIANNDTVVFNATEDCYVFQDNGTQDCLVRLTGVSARGLDTHGTMAGGVWPSG
ncbi:MAG: hypothetical protein EPN21_17905 [Methylococcaceae bacterium]|nr:MAG: hypothetical protein EPN21_17905 [Methylococcaceae bacterium]